MNSTTFSEDLAAIPGSKDCTGSKFKINLQIHTLITLFIAVSINYMVD